MSAPPRLVKLAVFNDFICPNCFVGQHELLSAIAYAQNVLHLNLRFELEFLPFKLISEKCISVDSPKVSKAQFFSQKLGADNFNALQASMEKWSQEKGVPLSFKGNMSSTTRAHRLSRKAYLLGGQKLQVPFLCSVFKAALSTGDDIADINVLATIAEHVGVMSRETAIEFLKSDELEADVNRIIEESKSRGITGVPLAVLDGKWAFAGGLSSEIFIKAFEKLAACSNTDCANTPTPPFTVPMTGDLVAQPIQQIC